MKFSSREVLSIVEYKHIVFYKLTRWINIAIKSEQTYQNTLNTNKWIFLTRFPYNKKNNGKLQHIAKIVLYFFFIYWMQILWLTITIFLLSLLQVIIYDKCTIYVFCISSINAFLDAFPYYRFLLNRLIFSKKTWNVIFFYGGRWGFVKSDDVLRDKL